MGGGGDGRLGAELGADALEPVAQGALGSVKRLAGQQWGHSCSVWGGSIEPLLAREECLADGLAHSTSQWTVWYMELQRR